MEKQKDILSELKFYERKTAEFLESQKNYKPTTRGFTEKQRLDFYRSLLDYSDQKLRYSRAVLIQTLARLKLPAQG